jgi:hypothetical protein
MCKKGLMHRKRIFSGILSLLFICGFGFAEEVLDLFPGKPGSLIGWTETRSIPRPLRIYYLKVVLSARELEVVALPGEDPDGAGPAESQLTPPLELFRKYQVLAAVNANAFAALSKDNTAATNWVEGLPVDIHGLVVSHGKTISPVESNRTPFWLDAARKPHIGNPLPADIAVEAVNDWISPLVVNSLIIPDSADKALHPRTALGFDDSGQWLLMVVVDGRQPGFSEGVSLYELAQILQARGCSQSINLDGGGSSIMLIREPGMEARTWNRPSGKTHRPLPVMLGVRRK